MGSAAVGRARMVGRRTALRDERVAAQFAPSHLGAPSLGARIGARVTFRPRTRVRFPSKLSIGRDCWIGEGVWFHNQAPITVGHDVVISQETMLTTAATRTGATWPCSRAPSRSTPGAWIASRCVVTGGVTIGRSAVIAR